MRAEGSANAGGFRLPSLDMMIGIAGDSGVDISGVPGYFAQFQGDVAKMKAALGIVVVFTVITLMFAYFLLPNHSQLIAALAPSRSSFIQDETMAFTSVFAGSIFSAIFLCFCIIKLYGRNREIGLIVFAYLVFCIVQIAGLIITYKTATTLKGLDAGNYILLASQFGNGLFLILAAFLISPRGFSSKFVGVSIGILVAAPSLHNPSSLIHARNNKTKSDSDVDNLLKNR